MRPEDFVSEDVTNAFEIVVKIALIYGVAIWAALVFWTYSDIRRRTRDEIVQTLAVMLPLTLFVPGYWLYLLVRPGATLAERSEEQLRQRLLAEAARACPRCEGIVHDDYLVCPACQLPLNAACRGCARAIQQGWRACPFCGLSRADAPVPAKLVASGLATAEGRTAARAQ